MRLSTIVLVLACSMAFVGQAQAQWTVCPPVYYETTPVIYGPPIYYETMPVYSPPIYEICPEPIRLAPARPKPTHPAPAPKKAPKLLSTEEIVKVDGYTNAVVKRVPTECQPASVKVTLRETDFGSSQRTTTFLKEVQIYDVTVTVHIPQVDQDVVLRSYEERTTYRNGRLYEISWEGWSARPDGEVYWEEKVRFVNGEKTWVIPHRKTEKQQPALAPKPYKLKPTGHSLTPAKVVSLLRIR